ncbi:sulfite exporter TauE/SafE family protein [Rubrobacter tropicus]|uniref:sulfite exporter TauE/SafE family protein n=1 Tax=Rubrobacter tropicus TaxID=2653851 RepID=UPI0014080F4E|nr:sulfite exporter TauE/SafE family protein [Rubrobacter tropicus]
MLTWSLLVALVAALLAGTVTGLTGFGLALVSTPLLLFVYEPRTVVVLTVFFSIFINIAVVWDSWREARRALALALLLPSVVGVVLGAEVLRVVDPVYIRLAVGLVVVFSALLLVREVRLPGAGTRWGPVVAGSASGALSTSTGLAAPPIVLLLASRRLPKAEFRSTSALYFLAMSLVGLVVLGGRGLIEAGEVSLGAVLVPSALVGKVLGTALLKRVSERAFRAFSLGLVIMTGTLGVATALWALIG